MSRPRVFIAVGSRAGIGSAKDIRRDRGLDDVARYSKHRQHPPADQPARSVAPAFSCGLRMISAQCEGNVKIRGCKGDERPKTPILTIWTNLSSREILSLAIAHVREKSGGVRCGKVTPALVPWADVGLEPRMGLATRARRRQNEATRATETRVSRIGREGSGSFDLPSLRSSGALVVSALSCPPDLARTTGAVSDPFSF